MRLVSEKMGIQAGTRAHIIGATPEALEALSLPPVDLTEELQGLYSYLHLFVTRADDMEAHFPTLRDHLSTAGMLWISWPKAKQLGTDLSLPEVIRIGYRHGLVESKTLAVDATWSAVKFTHPRPGQHYNNSFGTLPSGT